MKRCFSTLLLLLILCSFPAFADPPPEDVLRPEPDEYGYLFLQPNFGLNWSALQTDSIRANNQGETNNPVIASGSGLGFFLGLDIGAVFSEHWGARLGIHFDKRVVENDGAVNNVCTITSIDQFGDTVFTFIDTETDVDYNLTVQYLTFSPSIDYRAGNFFGSLGYSVDLPLSAKYSEDVVIDENSVCNYFPFQPDSTKHLTDEVTDDLNVALRSSVQLGVGYIMPLAEDTDLVFELGYDHPLSDFSDNAFIQYQNVEPNRRVNTFFGVFDGSTRFGTLQASVGVRFNRIIDLW